MDSQNENKIEADHLKLQKGRAVGLQKMKQNDEERDLQNDLVDYSKPCFGDGVL